MFQILDQARGKIDVNSSNKLSIFESSDSTLVNSLSRLREKAEQVTSNIFLFLGGYNKNLYLLLIHYKRCLLYNILQNELKTKKCSPLA